MSDWMIKIVTSDNGAAAFVPDFRGAKQGTPVEAEQEDNIGWSNQTNDVHQPWLTDANYKPFAQSNLSAPIPAGQPSNSYACLKMDNAARQWTIHYYCKLHPNNPQERGSIIVTALPRVLNITEDTSVNPSVVNFPGQGGNPFSAVNNDFIKWNNFAAEPHQPWPADANFNPLPVPPGSPYFPSAVIPAGGSSPLYTLAPPAANPPSWTLNFFCKLHPNNQSERGSIAVTPPPQNTINVVDQGMGVIFDPPVKLALKNDLINWSNITGAAHQPCAADANYQPLPPTGWPGSLSGVIQPQGTSSNYTLVPPNATTNSWTIYYFCKLHPDAKTERGTIFVPPPNG